MRHKHEHTLEHLFAHPVNLNIDWKQVVHLFEALGAHVEETKHGRLKVTLGDEVGSFAIPRGHSIDSKDEVLAIRHFLEAAGAAPEYIDEDE